ncbi:MAG TPA: Uma2 family endonuclease, partial [Aggregatilineales bacterium]|nr:Uma2 family endonuclease [Aggregatilineales bacterium]
MVFKDRIYTVTEYEAFAARHPSRRFELIDGEIIEKMPTQVHAYIVGMLSGFLFIFLRQNPIGYALVEARYALPDDPENSRIPDLSFISQNRGKLVAEGAAPYMPDLAVEVQSPGQSDRLMTQKAAYYLEHGSRSVCLIYPDHCLVEVLTDDDRYLLTDAAILDGG